MRRILLFVSFVMLTGMLYAQPGQNKINVLVSIKCTNAPQFSIWNDTIREGEMYSMRATNLASPYNVAQSLYNSMVGSYFMFEDGCIDTNIQVRITFSNVNCSNGLFVPANALSLFFSWRIEVFTFDGIDPLPSPFTFNSPNKFKLVIKKSGLFNAFVQQSGLNPAALLAFAYLQGTGTFDLTGITTENFSDSIRVRISHFSDVVGSTQQGLVGVNEVLSGIPEIFALEQNYPNPFNPSTRIQYSVPERSEVSLTVYDIMGVEVASLVDEVKEAGNYETGFDASGLPSGMYLYKLRAGNVVLSKKMLLVK